MVVSGLPDPSPWWGLWGGTWSSNVLGCQEAKGKVMVGLLDQSSSTGSFSEQETSVPASELAEPLSVSGDSPPVFSE